MKIGHPFQMSISCMLMFGLLTIQPAFEASAASASATRAAVMSAQASPTLERGYRTGYSDGYQAGYRDFAERAEADYRSKEEYQRADRTYIESYGSLEDFRDGYQQGYEAGYRQGYEQRPFNSSIPAGLGRRGSGPDISGDPTGAADPTLSSGRDSNTRGVGTGASVVIPAETIMRVELLTNLSTDASQRGDRFQARVIEPAEYEGAMLDGRVSGVQRPGKVKGTAELQLSFEQIRLPDGRWTNLEAQVIEVIQPTDRRVGDVDREGGVRGRDSRKGDATKIGSSAVMGAIIGAIAGGGKGAAIGAAIGGAVGTSGVLISRGDDIRLSRGDHLRIRTSRNTRL